MATATGDLVDLPENSDGRDWLGQWNSSVTSYYALVGASALLLALGLTMVLSATTIESIAAGQSPYAEGLRQAQFFLLGLPVMIIASRLPVTFFKKIAWPALFGAMLLQSLTLVPAFSRTAGTRAGWIVIGGLNMQPAEAGKVALALWLGLVLSRKQHLLHDWKHLLLPGVLGALAIIGLVMAGDDLTSAFIFIALAMGALFVAGTPLRYLALGAGAGAVVMVSRYVLGSSTRITRIMATFDPYCDPLGVCFQMRHGMFALGSGGMFGVGLGGSREKWRYLPEAHNDFIFAIIGEELGLMGTLTVLVLFVVLGLAMTRVIRRHPDPFVKITTAAIFCWIIAQAFINIGVVIGLFPVIGLPLPLISAGGSALITTMLGLGIVISFARSEPGAYEALTARGNVVRRTLAVLGRGSRVNRRVSHAK